MHLEFCYKKIEDKHILFVKIPQLDYLKMTAAEHFVDLNKQLREEYEIDKRIAIVFSPCNCHTPFEYKAHEDIVDLLTKYKVWPNRFPWTSNINNVLTSIDLDY